MNEFAYEPFVILERGAAPPTEARPARPTTFRGRKPAILIVGQGGAELDLPLAAEGFEVYRTADREPALELLRGHPSILMALVRMDVPSLDPAELVRDLRAIRPGLWIGLWGDPASRDRAASGYAAGATDLLPVSGDPVETAERLGRTLPWAVRLREAAERRERRRPRRLRPLVGRAAASALALVLGVGLAVVVREWNAERDALAARIDRLLGSMESVRSGPDRTDRQFDRWSRVEQLNLLREHDFTLRAYYVDQLELERARNAMWAVPPPQYSVR
jgi:hypothetical protein